MSSTLHAAPPVERFDRTQVQAFLPQLADWLLPGSFYGVQHTWPQLYRSDGEGRFYGCRDAGGLIAHCAFRLVDLVTDSGRIPVALLGSVATAPERRGQGLATAVLQSALSDADTHTGHVLLWAERPELYARCGFVQGPPEQCLVLARRPRPDLTGVRRAEVTDHRAIHALHERKPMRVTRSPHTMSGLLTTPGMTTLVREREGRIVAYACCGKGADLQGHWHEVGGSDAEVAWLLAAALHVAEQTEAMLLVPPYRQELIGMLGKSVVDAAEMTGPMVRSTGTGLEGFWVDGLDSV